MLEFTICYLLSLSEKWWTVSLIIFEVCTNEIISKVFDNIRLHWQLKCSERTGTVTTGWNNRNTTAPTVWTLDQDEWGNVSLKNICHEKWRKNSENNLWESKWKRENVTVTYNDIAKGKDSILQEMIQCRDTAKHKWEKEVSTTIYINKEEKLKKYWSSVPVLLACIRFYVLCGKRA